MRPLLALLALAGTAAADSSPPLPAVTPAAVEVRGVPAGPLHYRAHLHLEDRFGCGSLGEATLQNVVLDLDVTADGAATLTARGETTEHRWSNLGRKPSRAERHTPVEARLGGRARRSPDGLGLELRWEGGTASLACGVAQVPFEEADSATMGVLRCRPAGGPELPAITALRLEGWSFGRGAGIHVSRWSHGGGGGEERISLRDPDR